MSLVGKKILDLDLIAAQDGKIINIKLSDFSNGKLILFFYPYDFTIICPTEINKISDRKNEFDELNCSVLFISKDSIYSHIVWSTIPRSNKGIENVAFPLVSDYKGELTDLLGFTSESGASERGVVILSKNLEIQYIAVNSDNVGRSSSELLRLVSALNHTEKYGQTCAVDWEKEDEVKDL